MRILVGADVPLDPNSGAAGTVYHTSTALRKLGHEVDEIWARDIGRRIRHGNLHYLLELPFRYRTIVAQKCQEYKYDVIQLSQPHAYLAAKDHQLNGRRGVFINRSHGVELRVDKVVSYWQKKLGYKENRFPRSLFTPIIKKLLARHWKSIAIESDGIIVGCKEDRDFLVLRFPFLESKIVAIPVGVPETFLNINALKMTRSRMNNLLYVGQYAFVKGPLILAKIVNKVLKSNQELSFTWICDSSDHDKAKRLISTSVMSRVQLLNWQSQEELLLKYDNHGIFLFPSFFEGFGKAALEAMSRGLCVISTNVGGMRDYIRNGKNGFLIKPGDADTMSLRINSLINNLDLAERISQNARKDACTYTWKKCAQLSELFYQSLLERKMKFNSDG